MVRIKVSLALALLIVGLPAGATTIIGPWVPIFKGVDFSVSTNLPGADFPHLLVISALRVDLTDVDLRLFTTPRISNYAANTREIAGLTVSDFLRTNHLQAAINANFFNPQSYYLPAGTPMDVYGLAISEGVVVSTQDGSGHAAAILFDANNRATVIPTNWPARPVDGVYTAVAGNYPLVVAGKNIISRASAHETDPRTLFGLSQDRRFLHLVAIDGRQPGYSEGANDYESAGWLILLGAYDGVNMDGGGSTTLVMEDTTGVPIRLNRSSAVADSGRERTVGSHFGLFAKPIPGFMNDVVAIPDDTTARITWNTVEPSTTKVQYGTTINFGASSGLLPELVTNHVAQLSGLTPNTGYYFRVVSSVATQDHISPNHYFLTTNFVTTNLVFDLTNSWKYTTSKLDRLAWITASYDDSGWSEPEPALLWVDVRATGPNPLVEPKNTEMPADPSTGYPYVTYYFRTHFVLTNLVPGTSLSFSGYIDDGAVFYLNGAEMYRLRVPNAADAETLASSYPCSGDASCLDEFMVFAGPTGGLSLGDNVLAVEVHNYNRRSADITFGVSLSLIEPIVRAPRMDIRHSDGSLSLSWDRSGFVLQSADAADGPWADVKEAVGSPFVLQPSQASQFYRLRK